MTRTDADVREPTTLPASFAQELLWLIHSASPESVAYNVPRTRRLQGKLDVQALRSAFDALAARHEILRTTYANHGSEVAQVIHPPAAVPFGVVDASNVPQAERDATITEIVRDRSARPFDLRTEAPFRVTLVRIADDDHVLLFESHHIAFDGWSRDIVLRELSELYAAFSEGGAPMLEPLATQYADFAIWQRQTLAGPHLDGLVDWWRTELKGADQVLNLPTDFVRPVSSRFEAVTRSVAISPEIRDVARRLGERHSATLYMVLLAAYATVLHRYTGQADILVGSPIAGREQPELEGVVGYFANTIVQRVRFAGDPTFGDVLTRLRESALGAYDHHEVPFEKLVLELQGRTNVGQSPLFQVVFTQLDAADPSARRMGNLTAAPFSLDMATTKFDLTLFMSDRPDGLTLALRGRSDLFRAESVERTVTHIRAVLEAVVADPTVRIASLPIATREEREAVAAWNDTSVDEGNPATVTELFEQVAARIPQATAVVDSSFGASVARVEKRITYAKLNSQANQLAHFLQSAGGTGRSPVALLLDRSAEAIVALVGILKAGRAYIPLSVDAPATRIAQQVREAGASICVTTAALESRLPNELARVRLDADVATLDVSSSANLGIDAKPDDVAYVLYTSGSSGVPKGVAVTHANIVHYARAVSRVLADTPRDSDGNGFSALEGLRFGLISALEADLGNTSLYLSLLAGGMLHVLRSDVATDAVSFAARLAAEPIDVLKITPNHLRSLVGDANDEELRTILPRRWLVLGGETLALDFAKRLAEAGSCRVLNHYGPTEATVGACTFEVTTESIASVAKSGARSVPIGRPLPNTRGYLVDSNWNEQPVAIPGELVIGGKGIAQGYLNRPELTAERFLELNTDRVYRTGDVCRRMPDGAIEFLGRADDQVKIRGYRVELGEIEQALAKHPGVASAVVTLRDGDQLVAYVVPKLLGYAAAHAERIDQEMLLRWLADQLPAHMVPAAVITIDALPLTANGKVDRAALPGAQAQPATAYVAPRNATEEALAAIWCDVLKRDRIGVTHSFIDMGAHSLMAIRALGKISKRFGVRLPLRTLFETPTLEHVAAIIDTEVQLAALEAMSDDEAAGLIEASRDTNT